MIIARASEKTEKARQEVCEKIKALENINRKTDAQYKELERYRIAASILNDNARREIFEAAAPVIVEVLKKYDGKRYGDKTAEKIKAEIKERAGVNFWISRGSYSRDAHFCPIAADGWNDPRYYSQDFTVYNAEPRGKILDHDTNKITAPEALTLSDCPEIEPDPEKVAAELQAKHAEMIQKLKELEALASEFNARKPSKINYIDARNMRYYIV